MTKRLVDIDDGDLQMAQEALGTTSIKDTVAFALKEAIAQAARRQEIEFLTQGGLEELKDKTARAAVWR